MALVDVRGAFLETKIPALRVASLEEKGCKSSGNKVVATEDEAKE